MEAEVREVLARIPAPAYVADQVTLNFTVANKQFEDLLGYTESELRGMTIEQIRPEVDVPLLRKSVASPAPPGFVNWQYVKKDGVVLDVKIHYRDLSYLSEVGQPVRARFIVVEFWNEVALGAA
jgi:PAS domain S-box-containing protein